MNKNKLRCTVTGIEFGVSADRRAKLVQKFGSEEQLVAGYVSRIARNLQKQGLSDAEIKTKAEAGELNDAINKMHIPHKKGAVSTYTAPVAQVEVQTDDVKLDEDVEKFLNGVGTNS